MIVIGEHAGKKLSEVIKGVRSLSVDLMVDLTTTGEQLKEHLRLIGIKHRGEWYFYLTNIKDTKFRPKDIYTIYTQRWAIEIFFNELKHVLRLENIVCRNENGIKIEIYAALILYMMTKIVIREASRYSGLPVHHFSFKRSFELMTQIIELVYLKIVYQGYELERLIRWSCYVLVNCGLKDAWYINNKLRA